MTDYLERDMDCVEFDLLVKNLDFEIDFVESLGHGFELADGVVDEATTLGSVM